MPKRDDYYQETDRLNPHYAHELQTWGDGAWQCTECEGYLCVGCHREDVREADGLCGECLSEQAQYYYAAEEEYHRDVRDMHARGYDNDEIARGF